MSTDSNAEADQDPDADPEMLKAKQTDPQPDKAEGADDPSETGST